MENIIIPTELFSKVKIELDGLVFHRDLGKTTEIKFIKKLTRHIDKEIMDLLNEHKVN